MLSVLAALGLVAFLIWMFRDVFLYAFEIAGYLLQAILKLMVQGAVALLETAEDWLGDVDISEVPSLRALVMGVVGLLCGVGLVQLRAVVLGQPWVIVTFAGTVVAGLLLGIIADPEKDWSLGPFPTFPRSGGNTPKLPLNL